MSWRWKGYQVAFVALAGAVIGGLLAVFVLYVHRAQYADESANEHAVPRSYCLPDGSGIRILVWSKDDWQPTPIYTGDVGASNPMACPLG